MAIFDRTILVLPATALPVTGVSMFVVARTTIVRLVLVVAAIVASVLAAVVVEGGAVGDSTAGLGSGVQDLLSTEWPSPATARLIGTVVAVLAVACAVSLELARHRRFHLLPLLSLIVTYVAAVAVAAPGGVEWIWLVLLGVIATAFAALRNDGTLRDRAVLLAGERRTLPLLAVAIAVVALVAIPISFASRSDPRRTDPPDQTVAVLDPVETAIALRDLDPPIVLHRIEGEDLPLRWRSAAVGNYDGRRWTPSLTIRPIGGTLGPATGPTIGSSITVVEPTLVLVPQPGAPVSIDAEVETDAERTIVRLVRRPDPDDPIGLVSNVAPSTSDAIEVGVEPRVVDESTSTLTDLAEELAGDGSPIDRLTRLETLMRDEFVLDPGVQGGGLQLALIERFLRDTQRGSAEQFAAAYVLLARALGVEARLATGFVADGLTADGDVVLESSDARVWPEVLLADGRWWALDPVPEEVATDGAPPPPEPQVQTPAAPQPPIAPPPESETDSNAEVDDSTDETATSLSGALRIALRVGLGALTAILPLAAAAIAILVVKHRRRTRRLRSPDPRERIRGAWASATDAFVDAGLSIDTSATDGEIAAAARPLVGASRREVRRLAGLSGAATFGDPEQPALLADDAAQCLHAIDTAMATSSTRWQRLRSRLSLRSLRPSTRSPVST